MDLSLRAILMEIVLVGRRSTLPPLCGGAGELSPDYFLLSELLSRLVPTLVPTFVPLYALTPFFNPSL